jgi:hypothetical protein
MGMMVFFGSIFYEPSSYLASANNGHGHFLGDGYLGVNFK